jgi:hypothetical protein
MASCGRQADELAAVVERLAGEERAAGGRARTLTALGLPERRRGRRREEAVQPGHLTGVRLVMVPPSSALLGWAVPHPASTQAGSPCRVSYTKDNEKSGVEPMVNQTPISVQSLVDQDVAPTPPVVTVDDLPALHEQLLGLADRGQYIADGARVVAQLHEVLRGFPDADPRSASQVVHEVVVSLRRGPLRPSEGGCARYDVAKGWLDNIRMRRRDWETEQKRLAAAG